MVNRAAIREPGFLYFSNDTMIEGLLPAIDVLASFPRYFAIANRRALL
jgi:hypothetical protein